MLKVYVTMTTVMTMDSPDQDSKVKAQTKAAVKDESLRIDIKENDAKDVMRDEMLLMYNVVKWCVLAVVTGVAVGIVAGVFLLVLHTSINYAMRLDKMRYFLLFPGLMISWCLVRTLAPQSAGHGTEAVIDAIHNRERTLIDVKAVPVKIVGTVITISSGGSVGIEGPCAQIGSGVSYVLGKIFRLDESDMKNIIICGIAAGFCAVFGTPIAGAIFAVEVLSVGKIFYNVLLPALISGIVGFFTASALGAEHVSAYMLAIPNLTPSILAAAFGGGIFFGIIAICNIEGLHMVKSFFKRCGIVGWKGPIAGACMLLAIGAIFGGEFLGLGSDTIRAMISGNLNLPHGFIIKILAMGITLAAGGCGGEITPTLFIGASSGLLFARMTGLDPAFCAALGSAAVLAASTNTPISGTVLAMELFGAPIAAYAGIACSVAYIAVGHRSLYPTQILVSPKARTFVITHTESGEQLERKGPRISPHMAARLLVKKYKLKRKLEKKQGKKD